MTTNGISVDALRNLIRKSLLKTDKTENFWLHPLIREFSYNDLKNKIEVHKLAYEYYLTIVPEKRTKKDDVQSLIEAHYHACMAEEYDKAAGIIFDYKLNDDLDRWGEYRTIVELYSGVLPKDSDDEPLLSDKQTHGSVLGNLGIAYSDLGQVEKAIQYYEKALAIAQEIGDRRNEGTWLNNLGIVFQNEKKYREALACYLLARDIRTQIKDPYLEQTESNLNDLKEKLGKKKFEKLTAEVAPRAEEIVEELLK